MRSPSEPVVLEGSLPAGGWSLGTRAPGQGWHTLLSAGSQATGVGAPPALPLAGDCARAPWASASPSLRWAAQEAGALGEQGGGPGRFWGPARRA